MKISTIKCYKFLISIIMILSLVLPSYAALVNTSDGSAFVTKAEFDSALADFNSRLTTFEAGINSRIDSQVSSYLDRNGVWQGKQQELAWIEKVHWVTLTDADEETPPVNDGLSWFSTKYDIDEVITKKAIGSVQRFWAQQIPVYEATTRFNFYPIREGELFSDMILTEVKKSGMLVLNFELMRETLTANYTSNSSTNYQYSNIALYNRTAEATRRKKALGSFQCSKGNNKYNYIVCNCPVSRGSMDNAVLSGRAEYIYIKACTQDEGAAFIADPTQVPNWQTKWMYNTLDIETLQILETNESTNWYTSGKSLQWNAIFFVKAGDQLWLSSEWASYGRYPSGFDTVNKTHGQAFLFRLNSCFVY